MKTDTEGENGAGEDETPLSAEVGSDGVGEESTEESTSGEDGHLGKSREGWDLERLARLGGIGTSK